MNSKLISALIIFVVLIGGAVLLGSKTSPAGHGNVALTDRVVIHKSPTCGCCGAYGGYMKSLGYEVEIHETNNLGKIKSDLGIPVGLESCHTTEIGNYVVEGHVPHEAIAELFAIAHNVKGIGMAGMPAGSPGMGGMKMGEFQIYEILDESKKGELFLSI